MTYSYLSSDGRLREALLAQGHDLLILGQTLFSLGLTLLCVFGILFRRSFALRGRERSRFEGRTEKLRAVRGNLLDQFGRSLDRGETPLFVTEGTADDKLASINRSSYLSFAYNEFTNHKGNLVIFGHSLGESDNHLIKAMQQWGKRNIAISMRQSNPNSIRTRQARLIEALPKAELLFFDAETHPLGNLNEDNSL